MGVEGVHKCSVRSHARTVTVYNLQEGKTALFHAVEKGHAGIVKELLDAGANTEIANRVGVEFKFNFICTRSIDYIHFDNSAARRVYKEPRFSHITPLLMKHHLRNISITYKFFTERHPCISLI